jgi:glucose-6-phosphate isomerase
MPTRNEAVAALKRRRDAMFAGEKINTTEGRAVLHTALRNRSNTPVIVDGEDVMPEVNAVLAAMADFATRPRRHADGRDGQTDHRCRQYRHRRLRSRPGDGGSGAGALSRRAAQPFRLERRRRAYRRHARRLDPETTLFVVASKTFTTIETMTNARTARDWLVGGGRRRGGGAHFARCRRRCRSPPSASARSRTFGFWDWVGGRYSLWGAIGLPMAGDRAGEFRPTAGGAHAMDIHFRTAPAGRKPADDAGLIGYLAPRNLRLPDARVIPYDQRLARLPAYLQQLDMESNGKGVTLAASRSTAFRPGRLGRAGHQRPARLLPADPPGHGHRAGGVHDRRQRPRAGAAPAPRIADRQLPGAIGSADEGPHIEEARNQLLAKGVGGIEAAELAPHRVFTGNRPSITIAYDRLDPHALGRIIALYEHRVFVEAQLFGINAFDQWGVELGKELAAARNGSTIPTIRA